MSEEFIKKKAIAVEYDARKRAYRTVDASGWLPQRMVDTETPSTLRPCPSATSTLSSSIRKKGGAAARRFTRMRVAICDSSPASVGGTSGDADDAMERETKFKQRNNNIDRAERRSAFDLQRKRRPPQQQRQVAVIDPERALLDFSKSFKKVKRARTVCSSADKQRRSGAVRAQRLQHRGSRTLGSSGVGRARAYSDPGPRLTRAGGERSTSQLTPSNQLTPAAWSTPGADIRHASFSFEPASPNRFLPPQPFQLACVHDQPHVLDEAELDSAAPLRKPLPNVDHASEQLVELLAQTSDGIFQLHPSHMTPATSASPLSAPLFAGHSVVTVPKISVEGTRSAFLVTRKNFLMCLKLEPFQKIQKR